MSNMKKYEKNDGKLQLAMVRLEYTKKIIQQLEKHPYALDILLEKMEITKDYFFNILSGNVKENISYYDQALSILEELNEKNDEEIESFTR